MKFSDMLDRLRIHTYVTIRDNENMEVCKCKTDSKGVEPYIDYDVIEWFPCLDCGFVVLLDIKED